MASWPFGTRSVPVTPETTWRRRFSILTVFFTALLISWGGFVTSINAGMAVPDWPSTFGSYDPFKTGLPGWWMQTPVLAEHGHRLLGALVGACTLILAGWTWMKDPRSWMRGLGLAALMLVIVQGTLGGLRVTENSIALAAFHASTAQIFFSMLVAMTLFTTTGWLRAADRPASDAPTASLRRLTLVTTAALYGQIVLGALLRQFGHGIDQTFALIHITGAFVVTGLIFAAFVYIQKHFDAHPSLKRGGWAMLGLLGVQFALGLFAYLVLINEMSQAIRSGLQIGLTVSHVIVGGLLMASTVWTTLLAWRAPAPAAEPSGDSAAREPIPAPRSSTATS